MTRTTKRRTTRRKSTAPSIFSLLGNSTVRYALAALLFGGTPYAIYSSYVKDSWIYQLFFSQGDVLDKLAKIPFPKNENKPNQNEKLAEKAKISNEYEEVHLPVYVDDETLIRHPHFTLRYNESHEQAEWVAYKLTKEQIYGDNQRNDEFLPDELVRTGTASTEDYRGSGYDRGHLAPVADFRFSKEAMLQTCVMSNISPQVHDFNDGIWRLLEEQTREWVKKEKELYIITGPILSKNLKKIGKDTKVSVPDEYFKVILDLNEPEIKAICFLMRNKPSTKSLEKFIVPIDKIERITGINFFPKLPDDLENKLESSVDTKGWF